MPVLTMAPPSVATIQQLGPPSACPNIIMRLLSGLQATLNASILEANAFGCPPTDGMTNRVPPVFRLFRPARLGSM